MSVANDTKYEEDGIMLRSKRTGQRLVWVVKKVRVNENEQWRRAEKDPQDHDAKESKNKE